jgi:uroporphyrinogen decarboxylase
MTAMERVVKCLQHEEGDRIPVYPILSGVTRKLVNATYERWSNDAEICSEALYKAATQFDLDCIVTLIDLSVECDAWGQELIFPENDAGHPNYNNSVIKNPEDYHKIKTVDYRDGKRMMMHLDVCRRLVEKVNGELPIVAFVFGPLGTLSMLRNQQDMYMDLYDEPDAVKAAAKEVNETLKDYTNAFIDIGVNAVMYDTLFASGSIMSADMWLEFEGGLVKELADICHGRDTMVMIHNCGQKVYFKEQIDMMNPCAISFLYPPADCRDYAECKEKYGSDVTLIGCVTPANVVVASDEAWDRECMEQIDIFKKGGGFMLATGCEYPSGADFTRAERMVELAKTHGAY